jgi:RNA polymerase sigma factor (sigma-70 family)
LGGVWFIKSTLTMTPDRELLRQFADHHDEAAFAELVRRQADFVYSVALRVTCNSALAQDVTQAVFITVARQAGKLCHYDTLLGWLHTTTRHIAINTVRGEARRRIREQEATAMQNINSVPEIHWSEIGPLLDEAVGQLREPDRDAVLLRFFKNLSHQEVGAALGLGEDAARKRVDRALDKLREHFARRGVTASSALLATAIVENSVQAAPIGLVASVISASLSGVGSAVTSGAILTAIYMTTKTKTILAAVVVLAIVATLAIKFEGLPPAPESAKTIVVPAVAKPATIAAATLTAPSPQVAAPIVAPAPAGGSSGPAAMDVVSGGTLTLIDPFASLPNADLKTAIPALIHYLETDDYIDMVPFEMTPNEIQQALQSGQSMQDLAYKVQMEVKNFGSADFGVQALSEIQGQPASIDVTGTKATYELDDPVLGHKIFIFIKKEGLWYGPQ